MKKSSKKTVKTSINPKIEKFAKKFNIEFRVGSKPRDCDIIVKNPPKEVPAVYYGQGVIFVRSETSLDKFDLDIVCLHEMGHAILDLFPLVEEHYNPLSEVFANMVALSLAAQLRLPVSQLMIENFNSYNEETLKNISERKSINA